MILLDVDPNVVKPGWTPLFITLALAAAIALLYLSLRRQFRKIDANFAPDGVAGSTARADTTVAPSPLPTSEPDADAPRSSSA